MNPVSPSPRGPQPSHADGLGVPLPPSEVSGQLKEIARNFQTIRTPLENDTESFGNCQTIIATTQILRKDYGATWRTTFFVY